MGSFGYTVTTRATPDQALAYLADLRNLEAWVREVDSVEPDGDGYRVALDRLLMPDLVIDYRVDRAGDAVVATGSGGSMEVVDRWDVRPADGGAEVAYTGTYELKGAAKLTGPIAQLAGDVRAKSLAASLREHLDGLAA
jgi:carbon monoxide dehydrogenase subunit G